MSASFWIFKLRGGKKGRGGICYFKTFVILFEDLKYFTQGSQKSSSKIENPDTGNFPSSTEMASLSNSRWQNRKKNFQIEPKRTKIWSKNGEGMRM